MIDVAVIGLGRVASGYDTHIAAPVVPRSHIGAIAQSEGIRLVAVVDPDAARRDAVRQYWAAEDTHYCARTDELAAGSVEAVIICTPTETHEQVLNSALALHPRLVIVEKPLAGSLEAAQRMSAAAVRAGVALYVNFHRRFDLRHQVLRGLVIGAPLARILATYNNGLHNYASHTVDLLLNWFGPIDRVEAVSDAPVGDDPNLSFVCHMAAGFDALILGVDGLDYDLFDIRFDGAAARYDLEAGGARIYKRSVVKDYYYPGYAHLGDPCPVLSDGPVGGLREMYSALRDHLIGDAPFAACTAEQAITGLAVLQAALISAAQQCRAIDPRPLARACRP